MVLALASVHMGRGYDALLVGTVSGAVASALLALLIGLFSLRVRAIFFAMITLAVASAVAVLVSQLSGLTGGEDGLNYSIPRELTPAFKLGSLFGVSITGKLLNYYLVFFASLRCSCCCSGSSTHPSGGCCRPFARTISGPRRSATGWCSTGRSRPACLQQSRQSPAACLAIWLRYVGPDTTLSFEIMLDILLMVVIGGMGTMYGAVIGATIFVLAQNYLQNLMGVASGATEGLPLIPQLLDPDRWLLWLGVLFILSVYFFPTGIVGRLRSED
jgi:branched-chain amino acid transport system permease protein